MNLQEISKMNPVNYVVVDNVVNRGNLKSWNDRIEIIIFPERKHKDVQRKSAYKYGLCEGVK
ncbi:MAG: hypothetical protein BWY38_03264 [Ignavibacteria bacterium ADurb.Bin266]|nr:MAG: hypothetical protein BWY38_03264 [Ignavibacteria bacterium ADurb.Bin266]